jgi:hypothetical protein
VVFYGALTAIKASGFADGFGIRGSGWWALGVLLLSFAISLWAAVGVWRSAEKHVSRGGRSGWATLARVLVAVGLLHLVATVTTQAPLINQSLLLAFGHDTMPPSQLHVVNHGTEVEIAGGLSFGTSDALKTILDATPTVHLVQLNNTGGWIAEGEKLGALVEARKLATYTARECDSACLLVFMAGDDRYIGSRGKLGFHEASRTGARGEAARDGTDAMRAALERKGVPDTFISRAFSTPASSMWYPTTTELLEAHVVTAVVDDKVFGETGIDGWRDRMKLEQEFAAAPLFAAVARIEPDTYARLKETYVAGIQGGAPQLEIAARVRAVIIGQLLPKYLPKAPDEALVAYYESQVAKMRELRALSAKDCVAFLYPKGDEAGRMTELLSQQARSTDIERLGALFVAAAESPAQAPSLAAVQPTLQKVLTALDRAMPGASRVLADQNPLGLDPGRVCDAVSGFYDDVDHLPPHEAGPVLRYLVAQK